MKKISILILLFLSFSCSEEVKSDDLLLLRMVQLEDQVQRMNIIQLSRGDGFRGNVKEELISIRRNDSYKMKADKLKLVLEAMEKIDNETRSIITLLESYKIDLLKRAGENVATANDRDPSSIVWKKYEQRPGMMRPARLNLMAVKKKSDTESATAFFLDADGAKPSAKGLELWKRLNAYRSNIVRLTGTYSFHERAYAINPTDINTFYSGEKLVRKVTNMVDNSEAKLNEDRTVLIDLYILLTKSEQLSFQGKNMHWVSATFKDATLISAIAAISALEQDIFSARALALANYKSKISTGNYSFNTIIPLAMGPSTSIEGEEVQIKVLMAAFDSENQPKVTTTNSAAQITYKGDGTGIVKLTPKSGLNTIKGTVVIKDRSGVERTESWEWTINVMKK